MFNKDKLPRLRSRWKNLTAKYWWLVVLVAGLGVLVDVVGAVHILRPVGQAIAPVVQMMTVEEWAALAAIALGLSLLAAVLISVRRLTPGASLAGKVPPLTSRAERLLQDEVERYRGLYEEAEDGWWTEDETLKVKPLDIPQKKMGDPPGIKVSVMSEEPIYPIRLRFWFNEEVQDDPVFMFSPDPSRKYGPSDADLIGDRPRVSVRDGMVEVFYSGRTLHLVAQDREPQDVLFGEAQAKLWAYAASPDATSFRLLRVQRRYRVS